MTWNYRVVKKKYNGTDIYSIHEVFYNEAGEPWGCTEHSCWPQGETEKELVLDLRNYVLAIMAPVLDYDKDFGADMDIPKEELDAINRGDFSMFEPLDELFEEDMDTSSSSAPQRDGEPSTTPVRGKTFNG